MRILVVEDELDLQEAIAEGLRIDGYAVDTCGDGNKAYELLYVENYDWVLLDLNLPGMKGVTLEKIAEKLGYKTHSAVHKRIRKIGLAYEKFSGEDFGFSQKKII